jgi:3',5'-nucleoside bisphosphate phosphatase
MFCDLHIHSCNSSGSQTVEEICKEAVEKKISLISISDDDSTASYDALATLAHEYDLQYVRGVEVSAMFGEHLFRLLAYDFDINNKKFQELLAFNRAVWEDMGRNVVAVYAKHFSKASVDGYDQYTPQPGLGGFKHNNYMGSLGYDNSFDADMKFFSQYPEEIATIMKSYVFKSVSEVVPILHEAGAKVFVSAEYFRDTKTFESIVDKAMALGIDGFECFRKLDKNLENTMVSYAQSKNMLITGGGNGHGNWTDPARYSIGLANIQFKDLSLGDMTIY